MACQNLWGKQAMQAAFLAGPVLGKVEQERADKNNMCISMEESFKQTLGIGIDKGSLFDQSMCASNVDQNLLEDMHG